MMITRLLALAILSGAVLTYADANTNDTNAPRLSSSAVSDKSSPVNPDPARLIWIQPGSFTMGSPSTEKSRRADEGPQTLVTISKGFWMSKHETTQEEYLAVMDSNPSNFQGDPKHPVEQVSWEDATNYCARLTVRERSAGRLPTGYDYRLPTEAEWEYACRAGTTSATAYGNSLNSAQANFKGAYPYGEAAKGPNSGATARVESHGPNAWGLYDMHGNVWEWCLNWYAGSLPGGSVTDPQGPNKAIYRPLRGGGWLSYGWDCRSATRFILLPENNGDDIGFRTVLAQAGLD
jgi:formylglycine-generating enzyme required for sulfatase activity